MTTRHPKRSHKDVHLIYFCGTAKLRTFRIGRKAAIFGVAVIVLTGIWAVLSTAVLYWTVHSKMEITDHLISTREQLFHYQARFNLAYERAYPVSSTETADAEPWPSTHLADDGRHLPADLLSFDENDHSGDNQLLGTRLYALALLASDDQEGSHRALGGDEPARPSLSPIVEPDTELEIGDAGMEDAEAFNLKVDDSQTTKPTPASPAPAVVIDERITLQDDGRLAFDFSIQNNQAGQNVRGRVHAVATYVDASQSRHFIGAPSAISPNAISGIASRPTASEAFSVRRFRPTQFTFAPPRQLEGHFEKVTVNLLDMNGNLLQTKAIELPDLAMSRPQ